MSVSVELNVITVLPFVGSVSSAGNCFFAITASVSVVTLVFATFSRTVNQTVYPVISIAELSSVKLKCFP